MLPAITWRGDAIMRLVLSVFICAYSGSVLSVMLSRLMRLGIDGFGTVGALGGAALLCLGACFWQVRKPWHIETLKRQAGWAMGLFYVGMMLGMFTQKAAGTGKLSAVNIILGGIAFQGAVIVLGHLFLREHSVNWREAFGISEKPRSAVLAGIAIGCICLPMGWALQQVCFWLIHAMALQGIKPQEQEAVQALKTAISWWDRGALGFVTIVLAPVAEEILFRGVVYTWIRQIGFPRLALWGTAVLFGLVHLNVLIFLPLVALSVVLTMLYVRTGNLLAPIAAHAVFNLLNFLMLQLISPRVG